MDLYSLFSALYVACNNERYNALYVVFSFKLFI